MSLVKTATVEAYANEINGYVNKTAEMIVRIGDTFNRAKTALPHGEFSKLFDLTPVGQRQSQKYMKIANSTDVQSLLKSEPNSHLNMKQLYQLATGKEDKKDEWETYPLTDKEISAGLGYVHKMATGVTNMFKGITDGTINNKEDMKTVLLKGDMENIIPTDLRDEDSIKVPYLLLDSLGVILAKSNDVGYYSINIVTSKVNLISDDAAKQLLTDDGIAFDEDEKTVVQNYRIVWLKENSDSGLVSSGNLHSFNIAYIIGGIFNELVGEDKAKEMMKK